MNKLVLIIFLNICSLCFGMKDNLVIGLLEYPPYIKIDNTSYSGMAVEIINESFSRMNQKKSFVLYPIARSLNALEEGEIDGFFSIKKTPEREKTLIFPKEYLFSQDYVFFINKDSFYKYDGSFNSIRNLKIGVVNAVSYGSIFDTAVKNKILKNLDYANNFESSFKKLMTKRIDIMICSKMVGIEFIKKLGLENKVVISGPIVETTYSYIAFSNKKEYINLADSFDKAIQKMRKDGTLKRIQQKYLLKSFENN